MTVYAKFMFECNFYYDHLPLWYIYTHTHRYIINIYNIPTNKRAIWLKGRSPTAKTAIIVCKKFYKYSKIYKVSK